MKHTNETLIETAMEIAKRAHEGQTRNDKTTPYFVHPLAVAKRLSDSGESAEVVAAGFLHDVLGDTPVSVCDLQAHGIPDSVIEAVRLLTKKKGAEKISNRSYVTAISGNIIARRVKIADMLHNLSDKPTERQIMRYSRGLLVLVDAEQKARAAATPLPA